MCAKLSQVFDASKVDPAKGFDPIPADWYKAMITGSELKPGSQAGNSQIRFDYTIVDGPFKGRKIFDGINWTHKKPEVQAIGQQQFSAICHAVGVIKVPDTKVLHDKPLMIKVALEPERYVDAQNQTVPAGTKGAKHYDAGNRVKGWKEIEGGTGVATTAGTAPAWAGKTNAAPAAPVVEETPPPAEEPEVAEPGPGIESPEGPDLREFYAYLDGENKEMTGAEIADALRDGMPEDTSIVIQGESDWKTAADYDIVATPAVEEVAPPLPTPPVKKTPPAPAAKVVAVPAKAAPVAAAVAPAAGAKKTPPWVKK